MLSRLRPIYNQIAMPLGRFSTRLGIKPDYWTMFSLLLAIVAGYLLAKGFFGWGFVLVVLMYLADMMDGATARAAGTSSKFGTVLDHVIDRYAEYIVISGLMLGGWITPAAAMVSTSGIVMASYVRAKAESAGGLNDCAVGIAGRAEKLILTYGAILALAFGYQVVAEYLIWLVGIISHFTSVQRLLYSRAQLVKSPTPQ